MPELLTVTVAGPILARMRTALTQALDATETKDWYRSSALSFMEGGPEDLTRSVRRDREKWAAVIRANGIQLDE